MRKEGFLLLLSLASGGATLIGGVAAVAVRRPGRRLMAAALGFSGGVMMTVSLADLIPGAMAALKGAMPLPAAAGALAASCAAGMLTAALLDLLLPQAGSGEREGMLRLGVFSMLALFLHNLPEGVAVYLGGLSDLRLGLSLAAAIALHNIPEGISVALPILAATKSRPLAVGMAAVSGLAEPAGALLAALCLRGVSDGMGLWLLFSAIAGLMLYIVFAELLPAALQKNSPTCALLGTMGGILVMLVSLCLV
jgi:ZIP family zinc transporter